MKALYYATIAQIRQSVATKKVSPVEVIAAHLERIEKLQPKLNAFVHLDAEEARAQADEMRDAEARVLMRNIARMYDSLAARAAQRETLLDVRRRESD